MNKREITERDDEDYFNDDDEDDNFDDKKIISDYTETLKSNNNYNNKTIEPEFDKIINKINSDHNTFLNRKKKSESDTSDLENSLNLEQLDDLDILSEDSISSTKKDIVFKKTNKKRIGIAVRRLNKESFADNAFRKK